MAKFNLNSFHMVKLNFKNYMEALADFGTDRRVGNPERGNIPEKENPINTFDIEYMRDLMYELKVGELRPFSRFVNEVQWGEGPGAIRYKVSPNSSVSIERLGYDLSGEKHWYTKKYFQINRHGYGGYEEVVTQELFDNIQDVYNMPPDSPKSDYKDLKRLVINMAERLRKEASPIFIFDKIYKMNEDRYLICFSVRGHGLQAPGQIRIEQNVTDVCYYSQEGYIRVMNYNHESPLDEHKWNISIPDADRIHFPTQSRDEIVGPIVTNMKFY